MNTSGFYALKRTIQEWGWYHDPKVFTLFMHLLIDANFKDTDREGRIIKRGQLVTSIALLAADTGLSRQEVRTCLRKLGGSGEVRSTSLGRLSILTICNYDSYQEQQPDSNTVATRLQPDSNTLYKKKEIKEQEERKGITNVIPKRNGITPKDVADMWNQICIRCSKVVALSASRAEKVRSRLDQMSGDKEETIRTLFTKINASDFLCLGSGTGEHKNWRVTFDWVFKNDTNWIKVIEGKFDNDANGLPPGEKEWRVEGKAYSKSDFLNHQDEYNSLENPLKNRLIMGHKIVWTGTYWRRDDYVL